MKNKRIYLIDIFKYICAIFVVYFHVINIKEFYGIADIAKNFLNIISKFIVPVEFFFIVSSFFFFLKKPNKEKVLKYVKRLGILYMLYGVLYIGVITENFEGRSIFYNIASLIKQIFITGYSWHGWYIPALIYGILGVYLIQKKCKPKLFWGIIISITVLALLGSSYYYILPFNPMEKVLKIFNSIGLFRAPIYIALGLYISEKYNNEQYNKSAKKNLICWIIFFILSIVENYFLEKYKLGLSYEITIFKILVTYFMLKTILSFDIKIKENVKLQNISSFLGKCSTVIYFAHMSLKYVFDNIFTPYIEWYLIIIVLTILTLILNQIGKNEKLKWINICF